MLNFILFIFEREIRELFVVVVVVVEKSNYYSSFISKKWN